MMIRNFKRIYWILIALAFFALAMLNIYLANFNQYSAIFNLIASFFFFAIFFISKPQKTGDEKPKDLNKK